MLVRCRWVSGDILVPAGGFIVDFLVNFWGYPGSGGWIYSGFFWWISGVILVPVGGFLVDF